MKKIITTIFIFIGIVGTASAATTLFINDDDQWARVRTENLNAEIYRINDVDNSVVCYLSVYDKNAIPDMECVKVASSSVAGV
jgi:hypothetical protein